MFKSKTLKIIFIIFAVITVFGLLFGGIQTLRSDLPGNEIKAPSTSTCDHNYELISTSDSMCYEYVTETYKCNKCFAKKTVTSETEKGDRHSFECLNSYEPTCSESGFRTWYCPLCDLTEEEYLGFDETKHWYNEYQICIDCGHFDVHTKISSTISIGNETELELGDCSLSGEGVLLFMFNQGAENEFGSYVYYDGSDDFISSTFSEGLWFTVSDGRIIFNVESYYEIRNIDTVTVYYADPTISYVEFAFGDNFESYDLCYLDVDGKNIDLLSYNGYSLVLPITTGFEFGFIDEIKGVLSDYSYIEFVVNSYDGSYEFNTAQNDRDIHFSIENKVGFFKVEVFEQYIEFDGCYDLTGDMYCDDCSKNLCTHDDNDGIMCYTCGCSVCEHVDVDQDIRCDFCGDSVPELCEHRHMSMGYCDDCGKTFPHGSNDGNTICDVCGGDMDEWLQGETDHRDEDDNGECDYCVKSFCDGDN